MVCWGLFLFLNQNPKKCPYLFPFRLPGHTVSFLEITQFLFSQPLFPMNPQCTDSLALRITHFCYPHVPSREGLMVAKLAGAACPCILHGSAPVGHFHPSHPILPWTQAAAATPASPHQHLTSSFPVDSLPNSLYKCRKCAYFPKTNEKLVCACSARGAPSGKGRADGDAGTQPVHFLCLASL